MKKFFLTIFAALMIGSTVTAQIDYTKPFIIDTIVKTPYGISLTKVAVQWMEQSNYGYDTTIIYSFRFYSDTAAMNRHEQPISVLSKGGSNFTYIRKAYTPVEFITITPAKMWADVKAILETNFGKPIIQ